MQGTRIQEQSDLEHQRQKILLQCIHLAVFLTVSTYVI